MYTILTARERWGINSDVPTIVSNDTLFCMYCKIDSKDLLFDVGFDNMCGAKIMSCESCLPLAEHDATKLEVLLEKQERAVADTALAVT